MLDLQRICDSLVRSADQPGESYGGRPEYISKTWGRKPEQGVAKKHRHFALITEENVAEVFGNGTYKLSRTEAAKFLEARTNAHRTSCYRGL